MIPPKATLLQAWPYLKDKMNLPVNDLESAIPFYLDFLGFELNSRSDAPFKNAIIGRDQIEMGLTENGGDSSQEGCFIEVDKVETALAEFKSRGLNKEVSAMDILRDGDTTWKVFYVVAPDGLCYCFGEKVPEDQ